MVTVQPSDWAYLGNSPLAGIELQRSIERYTPAAPGLIDQELAVLHLLHLKSALFPKARCMQSLVPARAYVLPGRTGALKLLLRFPCWQQLQRPRCLCRTAAQQGGGDFIAPVQRVTDFLAEQPSTGVLPTSSYRSAVRQARCFVARVQHRSWPAGMSQLCCA